MAFDINKLRQQSIFDSSPITDIGGPMGGGGRANYGPSSGYRGGYTGGYGPVEDSAPTFDAQQNPFSSIFGGDQSGGSTQNTQVPQAPQAPSVRDPYDFSQMLQQQLDAINKVYTPTNVDRDRMRGNLDAVPQRNQPGIGRALVAAGLSLKAQDPIKAAESVLYAPYHREMADWTAKNQPFYQAAQLENQANINERTLAGNVVNSMSQNARIASQERIANEKNETALIRANAYAAKMQGAEVTIDEGSGQVVATYPGRNGQPARVEYLGKVPGSSTAAELANIRGGYNVEASAARAMSAEEIARMRGYETVIIDGKLYVIDPNTKQVYPYTGTGGAPTGGTTTGIPSGNQRPETRQQLEVQRQERMRELANSPDHRKWFTEDPKTGLLTPKPKPPDPSSAWTDASRQRMEQDLRHWEWVQGQINPGFRGTPTQPAQPPPAPPAQQPVNGPASQGLGPSRIPMPSTDGPGQTNVGSGVVVQQDRDPNNHNHQRRVLGDGRIQESWDGGRTWR